MNHGAADRGPVVAVDGALVAGEVHRLHRPSPCSTVWYMGEVRRTAVLQVRITEAASEALDKLAEQEQRTRSDMARILLSEALKRRTR
jgi:hypothetical protein